MASIKRGIKYLLNNRAQFVDSIVKNYLSFLPDKLYLSLRYRCLMGHWIDWKNPKTFTEKIQWLKVHNRKPEYTTMVDKYAVKQYVADRIGKEYIIPTLEVWDRPEDIDWNSLPDRFVLKTTHAGGGNGVVICKSKKSFNQKEAIEKLTKSYNSSNYSCFREWPYKNVPRKIIAEKYMEGNPTTLVADLSDYKFFCFNGEPKYCQVIRDRRSKETIDFYDMEWNHQEFVGLNPVARNGLMPVARPECLQDMIEVCRKLSEAISFLRVDLYLIEGKIYFGEMTFFPASGFGKWSIVEIDSKMGDLIQL